MCFEYQRIRSQCKNGSKFSFAYGQPDHKKNSFFGWMDYSKLCRIFQMISNFPGSTKLSGFFLLQIITNFLESFGFLRLCLALAVQLGQSKCVYSPNVNISSGYSPNSMVPYYALAELRFRQEPPTLLTSVTLLDHIPSVKIDW